jgi:hypothetical protein
MDRHALLLSLGFITALFGTPILASLASKRVARAWRRRWGPIIEGPDYDQIAGVIAAAIVMVAGWWTFLGP